MSRLLVVDDEVAILFAITEYFTGRGYEVDSARTRQEAERLLAAIRYQLVFADLCLGERQSRDGLDIIRYVSAHFPDTLVVLMSAHSSPDVTREAKRLGARAVVKKPVPLATMAELVSELLGSI